MQESSIIFDTNSYREVTRNLNKKETIELFEKINRKEKEKEIISYATHVVAAELLSHLNDQSDPHFRNCQNAAIALCHHNLNKDHYIRFVSDSESILCFILYKQRSPHLAELSRQFDSDLKYIYSQKEDKSLTKITENLDYITKSIQDSEDQFISDMWNFVVKTTNSDAKDWNDVKGNAEARKKALEHLRSNNSLLDTAKGFVLKAMLLLNENDPIDEITRKANFLIGIYKLPIIFYNFILERILLGGTNVGKKSKSNWLWDLQLTFYIGTTDYRTGQKNYLITRDKDIIRIAKENGFEKYVLNIDEYLTKIGVQGT